MDEILAAYRFAIENDDGKTYDNLEEADVVIIGPSRAGKTPLCYYIASLGIKAVNIPLVLEHDISGVLNKLDRHKTIGLLQDEEYMSKVRKERNKYLGLSEESMYSSLERVFNENDYAYKIYRTLGIKVINMYGKGLEEVSQEIKDHLERFS